MLSLARVVDIHPESHAVDVVLMDDGRRVSGVQVLSSAAGGDYGFNDLAVPSQTGYDAKNSKKRDIYGVVSWIKDIPVVIGFLYPQVTQILFEEKERMVYRHPSDVYVTIDSKGNTELYHPSGAYFRMGVSAAHEDLTGKDYDKVWKIAKNTGNKVNIHLQQAGGTASLNIDPSGNIDITHAGNLTTDTGGNLSAKVAGTADVEVSGDTTLTTPTFTINGNVVINGSLNQGTGSAGGSCTMLGPLTVENDVVAGGISLDNHSHPDAQGGNVGKPT